jgi:hypothetical protein
MMITANGSRVLMLIRRAFSAFADADAAAVFRLSSMSQIGPLKPYWQLQQEI